MSYTKLLRLTKKYSAGEYEMSREMLRRGYAADCLFQKPKEKICYLYLRMSEDVKPYRGTEESSFYIPPPAMTRTRLRVFAASPPHRSA